MGYSSGKTFSPEKTGPIVVNGERALRKMVAELAEMPAQTCATVLSQLDEAQGERVRALLDEYRGLGPSPLAPPPPIDRRGLPPGLSPWLAELLGGNDAVPERSDAAPLPLDTLEALRSCAAELTAAPAGEGKHKGIWHAIAERIPVRRGSAATQ